MHRLQGLFYLIWQPFALATFLASCTVGVLGLFVPTASGVTNLVWSDEFNGVSSNIDLTKWKFNIGNGNTTIAGPGWGNNEREFYTGRTNNAYIANGLLHVVALKENLGGQPYP